MYKSIGVLLGILVVLLVGFFLKNEPKDIGTNKDLVKIAEVKKEEVQLGGLGTGYRKYNIEPTEKPTKNPTENPTLKPTESPTENPILKPTVEKKDRELVEKGILYHTYFDKSKGYISKIYPTKGEKREILAVGDSILLMAAKEIFAQLGYRINIDAKSGRQFSEGIEVLKQHKKDNMLGETVLIHLGTNGWFGQSSIENMMEIIGDDKRVILINNKVPRSYASSNNSLIKSWGNGHNYIELIDWKSKSLSTSGIYRSDGYHLTNKGCSFYADLILDKLK